MSTPENVGKWIKRECKRLKVGEWVTLEQNSMPVADQTGHPDYGLMEI
jgi:hypothetical protein